MRKGKLELRSDQLEDELLSCAIIKRGSLAVAGSQGNPTPLSSCFNGCVTAA